MQKGMITAPLPPHNRLYFVPTSKSRPPRRVNRAAASLAARFADSRGGGGGCDVWKGEWRGRRTRTPGLRWWCARQPHAVSCIPLAHTTNLVKYFPANLAV